MKGMYKGRIIEIRPALHSKDFWVSPDVGIVRKSDVEPIEEKRSTSTQSVSNIFIKVPTPIVTAEVNIKKSK